jgi:hypothetical protein
MAMLRVEFHCHTIYSKDSLLKPKDLLAACQRKGVDRVVVTDHNTIKGALVAQQLDPQRVIVGEEIMTQRGELLAAFLKEGVPAGLAPAETIELLKAQRAFISVSHPFDVYRKGHWNMTDLIDILPMIDAIEVFNSRSIAPEHNRKAGKFAQQYALAGTVGSDAHTGREIGKAIMLVPDFQNADDLRRVIHQGDFKVGLSSAWIHFTSRYAVWYKKATGRSFDQ